MKLEYQVRIKMDSGDTCSVTVRKDGKIDLGCVALEESELSDFVKNLPLAVAKAKAASGNGV